MAYIISVTNIEVLSPVSKWDAIFHFINGIYSGIPLCCNLSFVRKSQQDKYHRGGISRVVYEERYNEKWNGIPSKMKGSNSQYVRCDKCHKNDRTVEIKENGGICFWMLKK